MIVNEEVYWAIDVDTLTVINPKGTQNIVPIPPEVKDLLLGTGKFGVGSGNDKLYFDNIDAGFLTVEGQFSDVPILGEAGNYTEVNPWLWEVLDDGGDTRYGITAAKEAGGNRMSILDDEIYGDADFYVSADVKLFKRASGPADSYFYEDARLFFVYQDASNYASADFFNHHGPVTGTGNDAYGLSGFVVVVDGKTYKLKHGDDPGDPLEEIPPQTCIPYVDDSSFDDWNEIKVVRVGTVLQMVVNGDLYYEIDVDTLTMAQTVSASMEPVPQAMKDLLEGDGQVGIGSGNDKVYFDNVDAGVYVPDAIDNLRDYGSGVKIYPNPAAGQFTLDQIEDARKIEIYNLTGQKVLEVITHGESSITIGAEQFDSGVYFIRTTMDTGEVAINKLIIR
jgi:hypothetical protein